MNAGKRFYKYPENKAFAFTILDDTDDTTEKNARPIYELLHKLGILTTKTVWALDTPPEYQGPYFAAETMQLTSYFEWVKELECNGFEIAFHNASMGTSTRDKTIQAIKFLNDNLENEIVLHCNHGQNLENLYWGRQRYTGYILSTLEHIMGIFSSGPAFQGHIENSKYFWGDIAQQKMKFVRGFAFNKLDCAIIPPGRPYHDIRKPYIRQWFNTADAPNVNSFKSLLNRKSIDSLRESGGWCIVSTHFGKGFCSNGKVDPEVEAILRYIVSLPGWYVPVSTLLQHLTNTLGFHNISVIEREYMEIKHIIDRIISRITN
jgi:hypothetical protein